MKVQNIEFKAELRHLPSARAQCRALGAQLIGHLHQSDTYFRLTDGRLKRREAKGEPVEWIFYHRPDGASPRMSNFTILSEAQAQRRWGTAHLRPWLSVVKHRELWMIDNVRIHLDEVDNLGTYIEFEAIVSGERDVKTCYEMIASLRETFGPVLGEPVAVSYADLIDGEQSTPAERDTD